MLAKTWSFDGTRDPCGCVTFDLPALSDVSFQGATLKKVSFRPVGIWSLKLAIQSMHFDGAMMDKLTYAALKGLEADVSKVIVLA